MGATAFAITNGWKNCDTCCGLYKGSSDVCVGGSNNHGNSKGGGGGITEGSVPGYQDNWRLCKKCGLLFYYGNPTNGVCFKGSDHDLGSSPNYSLAKRATESDSSSPNYYNMWRWCQKCECLVLGGNLNGKVGSCPKGASHDTSKSGYYTISFVY